MSENKTISQIAKELGISRQAVYQKLKNDSELVNRLQPFTVKTGNMTVYTLQGQELIKQAFSEKKSVKQSSKSVYKSSDKLIDILTDQLEVKDKQIAELQFTVKTQLETIDKLTTALQAAQALHGMDKQQTTIEMKPAAAQAESRPESRQSPRSRPQSERPSEPKSKLEREPQGIVQRLKRLLGITRYT